MIKHGIFKLWHKYLVTLKVFIAMEDLNFKKIIAYRSGSGKILQLRS